LANALNVKNFGYPEALAEATKDGRNAGSQNFSLDSSTMK
jgi:hypothetical protein